MITRLDAIGQRSETVRRANLSAIVRELHARRPASRSELVARTGLTRSAIRGLIGELAAAALVPRTRPPAGTPGRPSPVVRRTRQSAVLALEVGSIRSRRPSSGSAARSSKGGGPSARRPHVGRPFGRPRRAGRGPPSRRPADDADRGRRRRRRRRPPDRRGRVDGPEPRLAAMSRAGHRANRGWGPSTRSRRCDARRRRPRRRPRAAARPPAGAPGASRQARPGRPRWPRPRCGRSVDRPGPVRARRRPARPRPPRAYRWPPRGRERRRLSGPGGRRARVGRGSHAGGRGPGDEVGRGQLTDEAADCAARETGPCHELGARCRAARMQLPDDRAQVRPADRLAALADASKRVITDLCSFRSNGCATLVQESMPCQETSGADDDRPALGDPFDRRYRPEEGHPRLQKAARCDVVAIASRDGAHAREVAAELGIPTAHGSYEALLADPNVDAVYIPLPNHLHAEWTIAAARAGKHVLCEKPLALTAAEAERMVDVCADEGVHLMEAFMYRHHPAWVAVKRIVDSGRIGPLRSVQSWFSYYNDDPATSATRPTRAAARLRHRLLLGQPLADAVRRGAGPGQRRGRARARDRRRRPDQRDPRVRRRDRDVHLLDPGRARSAGPHLRDDRAGLDRDPVQHPARSADADRRHGRRRPARRAGARDDHLRRPPIPTRSRPSGSPPRSWTACPRRRHPRTRSRTCGSSTGSSRRERSPAREPPAARPDRLRYAPRREVDSSQPRSLTEPERSIGMGIRTAPPPPPVAVRPRGS